MAKHGESRDKLQARAKSEPSDEVLGVECLRDELRCFGDTLKESLFDDIGIMLRQFKDDLHQLISKRMPAGSSSGSARPFAAQNSLPALHSPPHETSLSFRGNSKVSNVSMPEDSPLIKGPDLLPHGTGSCKEVDTSPRALSRATSGLEFGESPSAVGMRNLLPLSIPSSSSSCRKHSTRSRQSTFSDHGTKSITSHISGMTAATTGSVFSTASGLRSRKGFVHRREQELTKRKSKRTSSMPSQITVPKSNAGKKGSILNFTAVARLIVPDFTPLTPTERISTDKLDNGSPYASDVPEDPEDEKERRVDGRFVSAKTHPSEDMAQMSTDDPGQKVKPQMCRVDTCETENGTNSITGSMTGKRKGLGITSARWADKDNPCSKSMDFMNSLPDGLKAQRRGRKSSRCAACTSLLVEWVESVQFDYLVGLLIFLNAASIGAQTDYLARNQTERVPTIFRIIEVAFCICFTVELCLRLWVYRISFFLAPGWKWNTFDATLVLLQVAEESMTFIANIANPGDSDDDMKDFAVMKIMRILRLVRIMRLVRVLRLVGELHTIVISICGSMKSLCWTIVLLMLLMYIVGVYFTQLVSDHLIGLDADTAAQQTALRLYFGSLGGAMMSLFQAITGGLSWRDIVQPIIDHISPWVCLVFALYIAFCIFALMNIVTGVFVENALETARMDRDLMLLHQVRALFAATDTDGSGQISWQEFEDQLENPDMQLIFEAIDLDIEEAKELFRLLDGDGSGEVDSEEFVNGCFRLRGPAKAIDLATLMSDFGMMIRHYQTHSRQVEAALRWLTDRTEENRDPIQIRYESTISGVSGKQDDTLLSLVPLGSPSSAAGSGGSHKMSVLE